jgi:hypothetical protein
LEFAVLIHFTFALLKWLLDALRCFLLGLKQRLLERWTINRGRAALPPISNAFFISSAIANENNLAAALMSESMETARSSPAYHDSANTHVLGHVAQHWDNTVSRSNSRSASSHGG